MSAVHAILGPIMRVGLTWLSRRRLPQTDGALRLPGLEAPVEIIRDRWDVPHIYAENLHDLFFAQGFVHAQDRLWQIEINRRTATDAPARRKNAQGFVTLGRWSQPL